MNSLKVKFMFPRGLINVKRRVSISRWMLAILLIGAIAIGAIPGYVTGKWSWADLPPLTNLDQLRNLRKTGIVVPGWKTTNQVTVRLGGHQWSIQRLQREGQNPVDLLLMAQDYYRTQPEVEWTDIDGLERWKKDSPTILEFPARSGTSSQVRARFFRAWNAQTFAVVQWYAWAGGGHFAPVQWFWRDQLAQLRGDRADWIAVCLKIPIDPLKDLEDEEAFAKSLAQSVQTTLEREILNQ